MLFLVFAAMLTPNDIGNVAPLWNELILGDSPEIVAEKLGKLPEVSKIKVKRSTKAGKEPDVDINLVGAGYEILGDAYQINPVFNAGKLKFVKLSTGQTCRNTAFTRYASLTDALRAKYPNVAHEGFEQKDKGAFIQAELDHLNGRRGSLYTALTNGVTTVHVTVEILTIARPSINYNGNAITRSLNDLQWSIYRTQLQACGGTGDQRAMISITYHSAENFNAMIETVKATMTDEKEMAKDRL